MGRGGTGKRRGGRKERVMLGRRWLKSRLGLWGGGQRWAREKERGREGEGGAREEKKGEGKGRVELGKTLRTTTTHLRPPCLSSGHSTQCPPKAAEQTMAHQACTTPCTSTHTSTLWSPYTPAGQYSHLVFIL